jgi:hypothetical protein
MSYQEPDDLIAYITDNKRILNNAEFSNIPNTKIQSLIGRLQTEIDAPSVTPEMKTLFTDQKSQLETILNQSGPQKPVAQSNGKQKSGIINNISVTQEDSTSGEETVTCVTIPKEESRRIAGGKRSRSKNAKSKSKSTQKKNKKGSKRQGKNKKNGGRSNKNNQ